jgi:hypothetical protein
VLLTEKTPRAFSNFTVIFIFDFKQYSIISLPQVQTLRNQFSEFKLSAPLLIKGFPALPRDAAKRTTKAFQHYQETRQNVPQVLSSITKRRGKTYHNLGDLNGTNKTNKLPSFVDGFMIAIIFSKFVL